MMLRTSSEELLRVLIDFKEDIQRNLNSPSNIVWQNVSKQLKGVMSSKAVYTYLRKHREIWADLELNSEMFSTRKYIQENEREREERNEIHFSLCVENKKWSEMVPKDKDKRHLEKGWTDVFNLILLNTSETCQCIWVFKYSYFYKNEVKIKGNCKECKCTLLQRFYS